MIMKKYFPTILSIIVLTSLFSFTPGCTPAQKPEVGFHPVLSISEAPVLGKAVELTLDFVSPTPKGLEDKDLYYLARIELAPDVYELVDGDLEQKRKLIPGERNSLKITIKSIRTTGSGQIYGRVAMLLTPEDTWGDWDYDVLFISITEDGAIISEAMPTNDLGGYPVFDGNDPEKLTEVILYGKAAPPVRPNRPLWDKGSGRGRRDDNSLAQSAVIGNRLLRFGFHTRSSGSAWNRPSVLSYRRHAAAGHR